MRRLQFAKYKRVMMYLVFGVITTMVNIISYYFFARILFLEMGYSNAAAWILAVTFAYVTNRKWVFESGAADWRLVFKEIASFFLCRLATGVLDMAVMYIGCSIMHLNDMFIKCLGNIFVIFANYIASKCIIFKKNIGQR